MDNYDFIALSENELYEVEGGAINWVVVGGLAAKAAIGTAAVIGGVAIGVAVVAGTWYVLDKINDKKK